MGTRADFYVGRGEDAEWLGSIAFDGYPDGYPEDVLRAEDEAQFRKRVAQLLDELDHSTLPEHGWPWPWDDSGTTDFAYAFADDAVQVACFGGGWLTACELGEPEEFDDLPEVDFPDMTAHKNVARGRRSGVIVVGRNNPQL